MIKSDVTCPQCNAGYLRIELVSRKGKRSEYRCGVCDAVLEFCDGSREVAVRLTVAPGMLLKNMDKRGTASARDGRRGPTAAADGRKSL
jgi:hypothetical protein